jgi:hypothetical protein
LEFSLSIMPKLWGNHLHWHRNFPKMVWAGDIENHKIFNVQYIPIPKDVEDFSNLIVPTIWYESLKHIWNPTKATTLEMQMKLVKNCQTMKFEKQQLGNFLSRALFNSLWFCNCPLSLGLGFWRCPTNAHQIVCIFAVLQNMD